jgi:hypothetical protein
MCINVTIFLVICKKPSMKLNLYKRKSNRKMNNSVLSLYNIAQKTTYTYSVAFILKRHVSCGLSNRQVTCASLLEKLRA